MQVTSRVSGGSLNPKPLKFAKGIKAPAVGYGPRMPGVFGGATGFDQCVRLLEDSNNGSVADRIKELGSGGDEGVKISEKSLEIFTNLLSRTKWAPPTLIGLDDRGMISASWQNRPSVNAIGSGKCVGMATVLIPEEDGLFQLTAMFGDSSSDDRWVQVIGNLSESETVGFLDPILDRFYR